MSSFHTFFGSAGLVKKSREIEKKSVVSCLLYKIQNEAKKFIEL